MKKILNLIIFIIISIALLGEEKREIHVGDIIKLEIQSNYLSKEEIEKSLNDFEIISIFSNRDRYILRFQVLEAGTHNIVLGDKNIELQVESLLEPNQELQAQYEEHAFQGELENIKRPFPISLLTYILSGILTITIIIGFIILIWKLLSIKRLKNQSPIDFFLAESEKINLDSSRYFVNLTLLFKEYIYRKYGKRIYGKTSKEIICELEKIEIIRDEDILNDLNAWMKYSDMCKYTDYKSDIKENQIKKDQLIKIVNKLEQKSVENLEENKK